MATNRPTRRPLVAPPSSPAVEPLQDDPSGEALGVADDLQSMMAELAGTSSSKVTVYRVVKGQPLGYVFACSPDAFSLDTLRDKYNGGEFRLFISKDGQLWKNRTVYVEPKQVSQAGEPAPTETATVAAMKNASRAKNVHRVKSAHHVSHAKSVNHAKPVKKHQP